MRRALLAGTAMVLFTVGVAGAIEPYLEFREELNLSEQQVSELESIISSLKKAQIRLEADIRIAEVELDELLREEEVDLSKVRSKLEEIAKLQAELKFLHIKADRDAKKVLTEGQLKKFRSLKGPEWEIGEEIRRKVERDLEVRMKELRERQEVMMRKLMGELREREREMLEKLKEAQEKMMRELEERMRGGR